MSKLPQILAIKRFQQKKKQRLFLILSITKTNKNDRNVHRQKKYKI